MELILVGCSVLGAILGFSNIIFKKSMDQLCSNTYRQHIQLQGGLWPRYKKPWVKDSGETPVTFTEDNEVLDLT